MDIGGRDSGWEGGLGGSPTGDCTCDSCTRVVFTKLALGEYDGERDRGLDGGKMIGSGIRFASDIAIGFRKENAS